MSFYEILGISPQSKIEEIRNAYLRAVKVYHPDKLHSNANPGHSKLSSVAFQQIQNAWEVLRNKSTRELYDLQLSMVEDASYVIHEDINLEEMESGTTVIGEVWTYSCRCGDDVTLSKSEVLLLKESLTSILLPCK